jgi:large subunit ribosomal protein L10
MASRQQKQALVEDLKASLRAATVIVVADYRGFNDAELKRLRDVLRPENVQLKVAKNTLLRRAVANTDMEAFATQFKGPTALLIGTGDQVAPVKLLREYLKKSKKQNEVRGGFLDGSTLDAAGIEGIANLPSFDQLRGKLVMCIAAPAAQLVNALSSPQVSLARALDQVASMKQQASS